MTLYLACVSVAQAGIFYNVELKGSYEDNVTGLLSDNRGGASGVSAAGGEGGMMHTMVMGNGSMMPSTVTGGTGTSTSSTNTQASGDFSANLYADVGVSTNVAEGALLYLVGSAQHTAYKALSQFDSTIGGLGVGISKELGDILTARIAINGFIKKYKESLRDSSAYGASLLLKEQIASTFWLKQAYDFERNSAEAAFFTYTGNAVSFWAGFLIIPRTTLLLGYSYLVRGYDEPAGFKITADTASVGLEYGFSREWSASVQYDRQQSHSNASDANAVDNIFSAGLKFSY